MLQVPVVSTGPTELVNGAVNDAPDPARLATAIQAVLALVPGFDGLLPETLVRLSALARVIEVKRNAIISDERTPLEGLYIVGSGQLLVLEGAVFAGVVLQTSVLVAGGSVGASTLLGGTMVRVGLRALTDATAILIGAEAFATVANLERGFDQALLTLLSLDCARSAGGVGLALASVDATRIRPEVLALLPRTMMRLHRVVPIDVRAGVLRVAMENPSRLIVIDDMLHTLKGFVLQPLLVSPEEMVSMLQIVEAGGDEPVAKGPRGDMQRLAKSIADEMPADELTITKHEELSNVEEQPESAPIVNLVNQIFVAALQRNASDIHIEPQSNRVIVRFRIDGNLEEVLSLSSAVQLSVASRMKLLAGMNIAERRAPQDGRISFMWKNRRIDLRTSTIPTKRGEKVCLRVLDSNPALLSLDLLIDHKLSLARLRYAIGLPQGIVLVTGPTGSGKTTTLYSALAELNTKDVNISTVEDPVEYDLPGVNQVEVNRAAGTDFAAVLRALLRQDPDIILVGETRDAETARIAIEASLTGHLVFTTLHTNSAAASFTRLAEMGVPMFLVSTATTCVVAQRLARRICTACREEITPGVAALQSMGIVDAAPHRAFRGHGCAACRNSGFKGRVGLYEVMLIDEVLRGLIVKGASTNELESAAIAAGMTSLQTYGRWAVEAGLTTIEELVRTVAFDPVDVDVPPLSPASPASPASPGVTP